MTCGSRSTRPRLPLDHHHGAGEHHHHAHGGDRRELLPEEYERQYHREHCATLVDRSDLVDVADLYRPEVAEPRSARGQAREDQEQQGVPGYVADAVPGSGYEDHRPGHDENDYGADRRSQVGVGASDPYLGEYGRQRRENRGQEGEDDPHTNRRRSIRNTLSRNPSGGRRTAIAEGMGLPGFGLESDNLDGHPIFENRSDLYDWITRFRRLNDDGAEGPA